MPPRRLQEAGHCARLRDALLAQPHHCPLTWLWGHADVATSGAAALLVPWALPISCTGVLAPGPRCLLAQGADPWFLWKAEDAQLGVAGHDQRRPGGCSVAPTLGWTQAHVVTAPQAALLLAEAVGVTPAPLSAVVAREQPGAGRAEAILPCRAWGGVERVPLCSAAVP